MKHIISIKYKATSSKIFPNLNKILQQFEALYSNYTHSALSFAPSTWTTQSISIRKFLSEPDNLHLHRFVKNQALVTPSEGAVLNPFSPSFCCVLIHAVLLKKSLGVYGHRGRTCATVGCAAPDNKDKSQVDESI